jgi:hypothetical protein
MNNFHRFYRSAYVGRVRALPTNDLYKALTGIFKETADTDLSNAVFELAYEELVERGEIAKRGLAMSGAPADFPVDHRKN